MSYWVLKKVRAMKIKIFTVIFAAFLLAGCATHEMGPTDETTDLQAEAYDTAHANVALAEAAGSVSQSLAQLGATEQAAQPAQTLSAPPNPASYGMSMLTTMDWNGPIEPIVSRIADATHYQLKVMGKEPAIPRIVNIQAKNEAMGDILQNIGYQAGDSASIVVFPSTHTIELRYKEST